MAKQLRAARPDVARTRARLAWESLAGCHLCAHHCGANRLAGERGPCRAGTRTRFFSAQLEVGDELELVPTFAIALSGCDLRCDFCITGASSWNPAAGTDFSVDDLAAQARRALAEGARTVQFLGGEPTLHLPTALELVAALPPEATLVWKTNAHASAWSRELLEDMFDIWVADFKFGNPACAQRLAAAPNYIPVVKENLVWASQHTRLIVRHLLMPGHGECCWQPLAEWLAAELPGVEVSLRPGFWPAWHSGRHPELRGPVPPRQSERAFALARALELHLIP